MLTVHQLSKSYGPQTILTGISFSLNSGEKLALIGPNGCGKTTLLRILAGLEAPDAGGYHFNPPELRLGYLPQGLALEGNLSLDTIEAFLAPDAVPLERLSARLEMLAGDLSRTPHEPRLQAAYDAALARLTSATAISERLPALLAEAGLDSLDRQTPLAHLSGGQKTRLALARVLLAEPQMLLLDEPTNHLDLEMLAWLEEWLAGYRGGLLFASHDRAFIDRLATSTLEIDSITHTARLTPGGYTAYLEARLAERQRHWQAYKDQQDEIGRLHRAAAMVRGQAAFKKGGKGDSGDKFAKGFFSDRTRRTVARAKSLERRLEQLLSEERVDKPRQSWQMKLDFSRTPPGGQAVLSVEGLSVGYDGHPLLEDLNLHVWQGARIAIVGPNGCGKTTLLRTIAGALPPLAGRLHLGANIRPGYMAQEQEELEPDWDALRTIRHLAPFSETEARAFLHQFLFSGDDVFIRVEDLSYGERARLSLACLVAQGCNLLLLDEPVNHLDIPSRARFEQALAGYEGTVLAVVHDRYFIDGFASELWAIENWPSGRRMEVILR